MHHLSLIRALFALLRSENKHLALWDNAEPVSLDELKAKFAALARNELAEAINQSSVDDEELTIEELWQIFQSLEDLEDCPVIS